MKKSFIKLFVFAFFTIAIGLTAGAQTIYVKIRPPVPTAVVVRPAPPSPHHVWVDEEWRPNGGGYVYAGGYWAAPPHEGWIWVPGHWKRHHEYGEYWVAGHWRRP
jgi:hypothetical protein